MAVGLVPGAQSQTFRFLTNLLLGEVTDRQEKSAQDGFGEIAQDITLIFLGVGATAEEGSSLHLQNLCVVPRRHRVEAESLRALEEQVELDVPIAFDTGIRSETRGVISHERFHYELIEFVGVIKNVMIDTEHLGHPARVVNVGYRATARIRGPTP